MESLSSFTGPHRIIQAGQLRTPMHRAFLSHLLHNETTPRGQRLKLVAGFGGVCEECGKADTLHFFHRSSGHEEFAVEMLGGMLLMDILVMSQHVELLCESCNLARHLS